jgi:hypothetical protein
MAQTMNKEARRPTVRTYEGVRWFRHGPYNWVASVPGTRLAVERMLCNKSNRWHCYVLDVIEGEPTQNWPVATGLQLPWVHTYGSVKKISRDVRVLRAFVDGRSPFDMFKVREALGGNPMDPFEMMKKVA